MRCWIRKNLVHKLFSFQGNDIGQRNNMVFKQGKIAISDKGRHISEQIYLRGSCVRGNYNFRLLGVFRICHCDPSSTVKMPLFSHDCPNIHMGAHPWLQNQLLVELSHLTFFQNGYIKGLSPCFENRTYYFEFVILLFVYTHIFLAVPSMYPCRVSTAVREVAVCAKLLQSCPTLCEPMDCSPPGSSVHEILQARILEWVAMPSSRGSF